jgi:hypothetical protein
LAGPLIPKGRRAATTTRPGFSCGWPTAGVKGGFVHGATDELGMQAVKDQMQVPAPHATTLHSMGLNHECLTYRLSGRDFRVTDVSGRVARTIVAAEIAPDRLYFKAVGNVPLWSLQGHTLSPTAPGLWRRRRGPWR